MDEDSQQWHEAKVLLDDLVKKDGAERVVNALKGVRGTVTMQEAVSKWREFMRGIYRNPGEGPKKWVSRFDIHLSKIGKALHAVRNDIPATGFMHEFILGLILLDGTGLDPSEQAAALATSGPKGNSYMYQDVKKALAEQWSEEQLAARDKQKGYKSRKGVHAIFEDLEQIGELTAYAEEIYDEAYQDGFGEATDLTETAMAAAEELVTATIGDPSIAEENLGQDESLAAAVLPGEERADEWTETACAASRTFLEARKLINEVKNARGYFPVVGLGAYDAMAFNSFVGALEHIVEFDNFVGTCTEEQILAEDDGNFEDGTFIGFSLDECKGYALLDGGASRSVGGVEQLEYLNEHLQHPMEVNPGAGLGFSFAGGDRADAPSKVSFQVHNLDNQTVEIYVLDRPSPILLGVDMLKKFGLVIDYERNTVYSRRLKKEIPTRVLASGHLALDLTALSDTGSASCCEYGQHPGRDTTTVEKTSSIVVATRGPKDAEDLPRELQQLLEIGIRIRSKFPNLSTQMMKPILEHLLKYANWVEGDKGTNAHVDQIKCRDCEEILFKYIFAKPQDEQLSLCTKSREHFQRRPLPSRLSSEVIRTLSDTEVQMIIENERNAIRQEEQTRLAKEIIEKGLIQTSASSKPDVKIKVEEMIDAPRAMKRQGVPEPMVSKSAYGIPVPEVLMEKRPRKVWFSPPCGAESPLQNLNPMTEEAQKKLIKTRKIQRNMAWAITQLREAGFCDIYLEQTGRCRSWTGNFKSLKQELHGCTIHGCMYDMRDETEDVLLKKEWYIATTDEMFEKEVGRRCQDLHVHLPIEGGTRVALTANYPVNMCKKIAKHFMKKITSDEALSYLVKKVNAKDDGGKENLDLRNQQRVTDYLKINAGWATYVYRFPTSDTAACTLCADYGSRFTTCHVLNKEEMDKNCGNTTAKEMKETVLKSWIQHYGKPEVLRSDPEGCFRQAEHRAWLSGHGIEWRPEPGEAHWRMGVVERCIETIKEIATRMAWEVPDDIEPQEIFTWACAANNDLMRHNGYSPLMLLMGRTPAGHGLQDEENPSTLSAEVKEDQFEKLVLNKRTAYKACVEHYLSEKTKDQMNGMTFPKVKMDREEINTENHLVTTEITSSLRQATNMDRITKMKIYQENQQKFPKSQEEDMTDLLTDLKPKFPGTTSHLQRVSTSGKRVLNLLMTET
ncbi:unnamed protein product [Prorocentrum cordatum]|uniref:Integrase catalytic domain-containing protein n=1 Tax=Prorocentrum cordatum TaxID=2364126 RepID=A0ABN9W8U3_9DINO|nr:unnamed protein product [Polarella glacialis]